MVFQLGRKISNKSNWFKEWWLFFRATQNIFCPEILKSFDYFKVNSESFFPFGNNYSLSFCSQFRIPWILCWDFTTHSFLPPLFPSIWLGNSKSNGGQPSRFLNLKPLSPSNNELIPKSPNLKSPQKQRLLVGLNLYQTLFLGPKLLQKIIFLQIRPLKPT